MLRQWCPVAIAAVVLVSAVAAPIARAQSAPEIPAEIYTKDTEFTESQRQVIKDFVDHWIDLLDDGSAAEIAKARRQLIDQMAGVGSQLFNTVYSQTVCKALEPLLALQDQLSLRLNALIVASVLADGCVVNLIATGLGDKSPAVRYWAARTAERTAAGLQPEDQGRLTKVLADAIASEKNEHVVQKLLLAFSQINTAGGVESLLEALNRRAAWLASNPDLSPSAELKSITSVWTNIVLASTSEPIPPDTIKKLAVTSHRFMNLAAQMLEMDLTTNWNDDDYVSVLEVSDKVLQWAAENLPPSREKPDPLDDLIPIKKWAQVFLRVSEWAELLIASPYSAELDQLEVIVGEPEDDETDADGAEQ